MKSAMGETVAERLAAIEARIGEACVRAGRARDSVVLVAVAKTHPPEAVQAAAAAGVRVFGENKVQEAEAKIPECPSGLVWHLVGHLQRNKAARAAALFDLIHSADSLRLLEALDRAAAEAGRTLPVLLEVNVAGEASKFGLRPEETPAVLEAAAGLARIEIRGLMTMPPPRADVEETRPYFRRLRELRDEWETRLGLRLPELSMGMSHDFGVAIEEGATFIRVGTALFGERPRPRPEEFEP